MTEKPVRRLAAILAADVVAAGKTPAEGGRSEAAPPSLAALAVTLLPEPERQVVVAGERELLLVLDTADDGARVGAALLRESRAPLEAAGLRLRVAVHAGEVLGGGAGAHGAALDMASSLRERAEPGQLILSELTYRLLGERDTLEIVDLGEHQIEGSDEPMRLYAARELVREQPEAAREMLRDALFPLQLLDVEGEGGMGEIHLARDAGLRRTLAVKVLRRELASDPEHRARFFREARIIAGLSHPNVVGVHAVGELADGTPYFVMDYVEGGSFADRLELHGPLSVPEARRVLGEVAAALEAAHQRHVVHRDVKPSNVLFDAVSGRAVVTDWGIAGLDPAADLDPEVRLTHEGAVLGSPMYMSPEQLAGDRVGPESDLYSLGLLAFELLTGEGPFPVETPRSLMVAHLTQEPRRLSSIRPDVDPELDDLMARCLSKSPRERPSAADVHRRLAPGADTVLEWPPPGLERLLGRALRLAALWGSGAVLWAGAILFGLLTSSSFIGLRATASIVLSVLAVAGGICLMVGFATFVWAARVWVAGLGLGYGWTTLTEVAADPRGDTGTLIVGGREYVTLAPEKRSILRRGRIVAASLLLLLPFVTFAVLGLVAAAAAGGGVSTRGIVVLTLGTPLLVWLAVRVIRDREHRATAARRKAFRKRRTPHDALRRLVEPWYLTFEEHRQGAPPGRGETGRRWVAGTLAVGGAGALGFGALVTLGFLVLMAGSGAVRRRVYFSATASEVAELEAAGRSVRIPIDSSLTAEDAADLLFAIQRRAQTHPALDTPRADAMASRITTSPLVSTPGPIGLCIDGRCSGIPLAPDSVMLAALRGLSAPERAYLRFITEGAVPPEWGRFARVGSYDELAFVDRVYGRDAGDQPWETFPIPELVPKYSSVREVGYMVVARAALLVSEGRTEEAEELLRESVSVGLILGQQSVSLLGALIGAKTGNQAIGQLRILYAGTGRPREAAALTPPSSEATTTADAQAPSSPWAIVTDSTGTPSLRWEAIPSLQVNSLCGSPRGILFGMPKDVDGYMRGPLRRQLVQTERQARLYDRFFGVEKRLAAEFDWDQGGNLLGIVWWTGRLIRSDRMSFCARVLASE